MNDKRLTRKDENGKNSIDCGKKCPNYENCNCSIFTCNKFIINRLAELEDKIERGELVENTVITYINMAITNCKTLIDKALKYDTLKSKIENGTLIDISEVAKLFNKLWECPCDYIFDDEDVNEVIRKNVGEDWCEKNCPTEDYIKCWEQYIKAKLKELKGEV